MKINWARIFAGIGILLVLVAIVLLYLMDTYRQSAAGSSYMDTLIGDKVTTQNGLVSVVVINVSEDGALDTENALLRGDLYLLMQSLDDKNKIFFNDLASLQSLDEYQQGTISSNNAAYDKLEIGQFSRQGKKFTEQSLMAAGIKQIQVYPEPRQLDKYGQVIGEVLMADGVRYPLQIIQVESKYLGS